MKECVAVVDPPNEHVGTVDGSVARETEADVAVRSHLNFEDDVGLSNRPQQLVVLVQVNDVIPRLFTANTRD